MSLPSVGGNKLLSPPELQKSFYFRVTLWPAEMGPADSTESDDCPLVLGVRIHPQEQKQILL